MKIQIVLVVMCMPPPPLELAHLKVLQKGVRVIHYCQQGIHNNDK